MKVAIITGSSRGIGRATAVEFAKNGYSVVVNYNKSKQEAEKVVSEIRNFGQDALLFKADVSDFKESNNLINFAIKEFGKIDVLVNNAGISLQKIFQDVTESEWENLFKVNVWSVFNCCAAVANHMISRKKGKIVNVSSIWGIAGASMEAHYSASKAAIIGFTKSLAKELGPSRIYVNCVAPGVIDTEMNNFDEKIMEELKNEIPLKKIGSARNIAETILFLASEKSDFITGQTISPNGGTI